MTALLAPTPAPPASFGLVRAHTWGQRAIAALEGGAGVGANFVHAFLVLDGGEVLSAQPGGAKILALEPLLDRHAADPESVVFCDAPVRRRLRDYGGGDPDGHLEAALRRMVVAAGRSLEETPYSFLDYLSLAALHALPARGDGKPRRPEWLVNFVQSSGHMICSQSVDRAYAMAGISLYDDDRFAGDVTPGDLGVYRERWLEELAGVAA